MRPRSQLRSLVGTIYLAIVVVSKRSRGERVLCDRDTIGIDLGPGDESGVSTSVSLYSRSRSLLG